MKFLWVSSLVVAKHLSRLKRWLDLIAYAFVSCVTLMLAKTITPEFIRDWLGNTGNAYLILVVGFVLLVSLNWIVGYRPNSC